MGNPSKKNENPLSLSKHYIKPYLAKSGKGNEQSPSHTHTHTHTNQTNNIRRPALVQKSPIRSTTLRFARCPTELAPPHLPHIT
jgi:hypothetical protein